MRTTLAAASVLGALALAPVEAGATEVGASRPFGLGIQLGAPTGITGKLYLGGRTNAIDFSVGSYYDNDLFYNDVYAQVSYHWHFTELTSGGGVAIPLRIGVGGFINTGGYAYGRYRGDLALGARVPFGIDFDLETAPVQFYIDVAFNLVLVEYIGTGFDAGIGFRYYF